MTEFTKTKIHFALALLASLFALHPFLERFADLGFTYMGYEIKWVYAFAATAASLALCVYCFGLTLMSERSHSLLERLGNDFYSVAVMIGPLFVGLYLASLLANLVGRSELAWAAPATGLGLGIVWIVLSPILALLLRRRLGKQDLSAKFSQFAEEEVTALKRAEEMHAGGHLDLAVMETWRAVEVRLRRALLGHGIVPRKPGPEALLAAAKRAKLVDAPTLALLDELQRAWQTAIGNVPITSDAAAAGLRAGRLILASIAVADAGNSAIGVH
jgi:hypothetical protein